MKQMHCKRTLTVEVKKSMSIEKFIRSAATGWMITHGEHSDIVMSTRIRLARNIRGYSFPIAFQGEEALLVDQLVTGTLVDAESDGYYSYLKMSELSSLERKILVEKHLVSPQLVEKNRAGAVLLSDDETVSVMINEEDHVRIQCIFPGFQLDEAYAKASEVDDVLEHKLPYAFDEQFGYLTSCPSNTGTGMRASVMMHLPALSMTKQIERVIPAMARLGMVVRGSYGEGTKAFGNVYQVSNQITLGKTEEEILEDLQSITSRLIMYERRARETLLQNSKIMLENRIFRSLGVLKYARLLQTAEAARCLSDVRLGIDLQIIEEVDVSVLNELMVFMQPGFLQQYANSELTQAERDIFRAKLCRERLQIERT